MGGRAVAALALIVAVVFGVLAARADAAGDDIGDLAGFAATDQGDVVLTSGRDDSSRGALIFVHDGHAGIVHRFEPYNTPLDVVATPDGFVGWTGFPENGGGAFAVVGGRFLRTAALVDRGFGTLLTVPGVPYLGGLLVSGDGGVGARCHKVWGHSPCGALYRFDVHGAHIVAAFDRPTYPNILAGDGTRAWFRTTAGLYVVDARGIRFIAKLEPWTVAPLGRGSIIVAYPDAGQTLRFATLAPSGIMRTILRVPFSTSQARGNGFVQILRLGTPADTYYALVGEQMHRSEARAYALLPGPPGEIASIVPCSGRWVPVVNGVGSVCSDARGLLYVSPNGKTQKLASAARIAPFRATAMTDHSIWVAVAYDPPIPAYDPTALNPILGPIRRNPAFLVHFTPGQPPRTVLLPQ